MQKKQLLRIRRKERTTQDAQHEPNFNQIRALIYNKFINLLFKVQYTLLCCVSDIFCL